MAAGENGHGCAEDGGTLGNAWPGAEFGASMCGKGGAERVGGIGLGAVAQVGENIVVMLE